ncbi:MAG: 23S rRNA (uracil(1939)-C(5))-methyltransferase RlmD, partial [Vulcanimicrobiaceae bacterium]
MTNKDTAPKPASAFRAGAELDVAFTDLLANGQAVGRAGGMVVFCFGPLPRERARVRITAVKPKYSVAEFVRLIEGSKARVQPFCAVFGECGGCQVQHLSYPAQLAWKTDIVRNALQRIGGFNELRIKPAVGMINPRGYRNKMSLVVDHATPVPSIGFYQQRSHDVVPIDACPIVTPQLNEYIGRINRARLQPETAPALQPARHIVSRSARSSGQAVVTITTAQASPEVATAGPALLAQLPGAVGLTNSYGLNSQNAIMGRNHRVVAGRPDIEETIHGVRYRVSAGSFFQVNVEIVTRIFDFLQSALERPRTIVDLYCGAGTFSLYFAKHGCRVYGIEENPLAIDEALANATLNGAQDMVSFHAGRVEDAVREPGAREALAAAEIVFLDPPRKGSDEVTLGAIAAAGVPYMWYLSCDPATLARDLKFLASKGYALGIVQPFDMFPQTGHIETLV